jgi:hypothetical protein
VEDRQSCLSPLSRLCQNGQTRLSVLHFRDFLVDSSRPHVARLWRASAAHPARGHRSPSPNASIPTVEPIRLWHLRAARIATRERQFLGRNAALTLQSRVLNAMWWITTPRIITHFAASHRHFAARHRSFAARHRPLRRTNAALTAQSRIPNTTSCITTLQVIDHFAGPHAALAPQSRADRYT